MSKLVVPGILVLVAGLSACGGGGGDSGGGGTGGGGTTTTITGTGAAPGTGPGDTQNYFPHGAGDTWSYDVTNTDPQALMPTAVAVNTVTGTIMVHGLNATVFSMNDLTTSTSVVNDYLAVSAGGVTYAGNGDSSDVIDNEIVPYVKLLFPVSTGQQSRINGTNVPAGTTTDGTAITANLTQTISNASVTDTVDTAIGTYTNAIKQVTTLSGTATAGTQSTPFSGTTTSWLAPGAGIVKEISSGVVQGTTLTQTFDIRSYTVAGVPHGLGPLVTLDPNSNAGGINQTPPAIATDGTNFLIVSVASVTQAAQTQQYYEGTIVTPDGTIVSAFPVSPSLAGGSTLLFGVAAGYDGSNYLVVYEQSDLAGNASLFAVQVSPTGTVTILNATPIVQFLLADQTFALAFDGAQYLLVYSDNQSLHGQFISPATHQPSGSAFSLPPGVFSNYPAIAFDGANYLVAWDNLQATPSMPAGTYVALVSTSGAMVSAAPIPIYYTPLSAVNGNPGYPSIAFDGQDYLVAYTDVRAPHSTQPSASGISATRISTSGSVLDGSASTAGIVVAEMGYTVFGRPAVASYSGLYRFVWGQRDVNSNSSFLTGASVTSAGKVANNGTAGFQLSQIQNSNGQAAWNIAANPHGALMVLVTDGLRQLVCMPIYPP